MSSTLFEEIINQDAGVINGPLHIMPNKHLVPNRLVQSSISGKNLQFVGCNIDKIIGSGIGFDERSSIYSSVGEFFERYSASIKKTTENYIYGSHSELSKFYNLCPIQEINLFRDYQYENPDLKFKHITTGDELTWIKGIDYFKKTHIYFPASLVSLFNMDKNVPFATTSTGLAAGSTEEQAFLSGLLECIERDSFAKFWYRHHTQKLIKYSKETILKAYPNNEQLYHLLNNNSIEILVYDLSENSHVPTYLSIMYYKFKERVFFSCGCSSRFEVENAIIKSLLECYQGIEYAIILQKDHADMKVPIEKFDFSQLNDFKFHFWFYNAYPDVRTKVPFFQHSVNRQKYSFTEKIIDHRHSLNINNLSNCHNALGNIYIFNLSIKDIADLGFEVVRTVTPNLCLLSGNAMTPFLNYKVFDKTEDLFLKLPHFFP